MRKSKKVVEYFKAVKSGKPKGEAALISGYKDTNHMVDIEKTEQFQALEKRYATVLKEKISVDQIAQAHTDLINQTEDKSARLNAIKLAVERIEPDDKPDEPEERVLVVLKG